MWDFTKDHSKKISKISPHEKCVFLSFDDGPDPLWTPKVLEILKKYQAKATFFLIGEKLERSSLLIERMLREGHALGDHSWDHSYSHFFSRESLVPWLEKSQKNFVDKCGTNPVGFRPPAGVVTPPLLELAEKQGFDVFLWKHRFYDRLFPLSNFQIKKTMANIESGDILLLHDAPPLIRAWRHLTQLEVLLGALKARGFEMRALSQCANDSRTGD